MDSPRARLRSSRFAASRSVFALVASAVIVTGGACSDKDPPEILNGPTRVSSGNVTISSVTASGVKEAAGYRYTVTVVAAETGGTAVTVNAWDLALMNGSSRIGTVRFDQSNFGTLARTIAAHSTSQPQVFTVTDTGNPYATGVNVTLTFADSSGATNTTSASSSLLALDPCATLSMPDTSQSFGANGGTGRLSITAEADCQWTATSSSDWLSVQTNSGSGSGAVSYTVARNTASQFRSGAISIGNRAPYKTFVVEQAGAVPPPPSTSLLSFQMRSSCSKTIEFKFFDQANNAVWPSSTTHWTLGPGASETHTLTCRTGANVCYGATSADGLSHWGVGLRGDRNCENCCSACSDRQVASPTLTCSSAPPSPGPLPPAQCTSGNASTAFFIENDTSYTLQVDFVGPVTRSLTILASRTQSITVTPGIYTITARVTNASGVESWSGRHTISAGQNCGYVLYVQRTGLREALGLTQ